MQVYRQGTSFQVNGMQAYDSANYHVDEAEAKSTKFRNHNPIDFTKKASRDQVQGPSPYPSCFSHRQLA